MEPGLQSRVPARVPDEARLAEVMRSIRAGVASANDELHRIFYPGACFLIQRRLGHGDVKQHAQSVVDAAVRTIREDQSIEARSLAALVRQLIVQRFPARLDGPAAKDGADQPGTAAAESMLETMSPVERDALRRCYVLRQPPEAFLEGLKLTPDQFRAIQSRARAEFSTRRLQETNVA